MNVSNRPIRVLLLLAALGAFGIKLPAQTDPADTFARALAPLAHERAQPSTTLDRMTTVADTLFASIDLSSLHPEEIAQLVRLNAFAYGRNARAQAALAAQRVESFLADNSPAGALAATVLVSLSGPAGRGPERAGWERSALQHPAFPALLRGPCGDLALSVACLTKPETPSGEDFLIALLDELDASASPRAAAAACTFWHRITSFVPEGPRRQALRQRLSTYVAASLVRLADDDAQAALRRSAQDAKSLLEGAAARGLLAVGAPAPDLHFVWTSDGNWRSLADVRGQVVVLNFWATWCSGCKESFPEVAKLQERYRGTDVQIISVTSPQGTFLGFRGQPPVDCRDDPAKEIALLPGFIAEANLTWPVAVSREPAVNPDYGIDGIPATVVIAPDGTLRWIKMGFAGVELAAQIDAVLTEFGRPVSAPPASLADQR